MPRDFKQNEPRRGRQCRCRGWFVGGLLIGALLGAGAMHWWLAPRESDGGAPRHKRHQAGEVEKPRFDFYTILPEMEVQVAEEPPAPRHRVETRAPVKKPPAPPPAKARKQVAGGPLYLLQIASFRRAADADKLRARLALLGIETRIEKVSINDRQTYRRVRAGPFRSKRRVEQLRTRLRKQGLKPIVIRLKKVSQ